jgi:hypothetical protein
MRHAKGSAVSHQLANVLDAPTYWGAPESSPPERPTRKRFLARSLKVDESHEHPAVRPCNGTLSFASPWTPVVTYAWDAHALPSAIFTAYQPDVVLISGDSVILCEFKVRSFEPSAWTGLMEAAPAAVPASPASDPTPESAAIASEVRDLSGLSAEKLGDIFPIERESYQRWISGKNTPSEGNLERLLALRHYFRAVADRVDTPKAWLLSPLAEGVMSSSPYDLLRAGDLSAAWDAISRLPSRAKRYTRRASDGSEVVVIEGSVRGRNAPTGAEELDDYDDWLSEDE